MLWINPETVNILFPHRDRTHKLITANTIVTSRRSPASANKTSVAFQAWGKSSFGASYDVTNVAQFSRVRADHKFSWRSRHRLKIPTVGLKVSDIESSSPKVTLESDTSFTWVGIPASQFGDTTAATTSNVTVIDSKVQPIVRHVMMT